MQGQVIEADICSRGPAQGYIGRFAVKLPRPGCSDVLLRELLALTAIHRRHPSGHPHIVTPAAIVARTETLAPAVATHAAATTKHACTGTSHNLCSPPRYLTTGAVAAFAMEVYAADLHRPLRRMRSERRWRVLQQCVDGLLAARAAGIAHGDLKSENVFLRQDGSVAVGDWASARFDVRADTETDAPSGSPVFMAPEVWESYGARERGTPQRYRIFPADVWSLGVIAMQLALPRLWGVVIEGDPAVREDVRRRRGPPRGIAQMHAAVKRKGEPCMGLFVDRALDADPRRRAPLAELALIARAGAATARMHAAGEERAAALAALNAFPPGLGVASAAADAPATPGGTTAAASGLGVAACGTCDECKTYDSRLWAADVEEAAAARRTLQKQATGAMAPDVAREPPPLHTSATAVEAVPAGAGPAVGTYHGGTDTSQLDSQEPSPRGVPTGVPLASSPDSRSAAASAETLVAYTDTAPQHTAQHTPPTPTAWRACCEVQAVEAQHPMLPAATTPHAALARSGLGDQTVDVLPCAAAHVDGDIDGRGKGAMRDQYAGTIDPRAFMDRPGLAANSCKRTVGAGIPGSAQHRLHGMRACWGAATATASPRASSGMSQGLAPQHSLTSAKSVLSHFRDVVAAAASGGSHVYVGASTGGSTHAVPGACTGIGRAAGARAHCTASFDQLPLRATRDRISECAVNRSEVARDQHDDPCMPPRKRLREGAGGGTL